jgi:hypothetical protein
MIEVDGAPLIVSAVAIAGLIAKPLWPYAVQLMSIRGKVAIDDRRRTEDRRESTPSVPIYTKEEHDKWCGLRLDTISTRLTGIESKVTDVKEHEADAKESVREVKRTITEVKVSLSDLWKHVDEMVNQMHLNQIDTIKAINEIGKP